MDLSLLSDRELTGSLTALLNSPRDGKVPDALQEAVRSLEVHRVALEMQNRALREMQTELEQAGHRYVDLYDNLPLGCVTLSEAGEVLEANATAAEWLHSERESLIGTHFCRFVDPADCERYASHLGACRREEAAVVELTLRVADRAPLAVQLSSRCGRGEKDGGRIHTAITNLTTLRRTEETLQLTRREQQAFAYSVSHDMRSPLLTIARYAQVLLEDYSSCLDDAGRAMLGRIEVGASRLDMMLQGLLEISRIATDETPLEVVEFDGLVDEVLIERRAAITACRAELQVDRPLPRARCMRPLARRVVGELVDNAIKFVAHGVAPNVRISGETRADLVVLKVVDHGIGIEPGNADRIFKIFEQLRSRVEYPGNGIGLAVVHRAVERMGGAVHVEPHPGGGTIVLVELPIS